MGISSLAATSYPLGFTGTSILGLAAVALSVKPLRMALWREVVAACCWAGAVAIALWTFRTADFYPWTAIVGSVVVLGAWAYWVHRQRHSHQIGVTMPSPTMAPYNVHQQMIKPTDLTIDALIQLVDRGRKAVALIQDQDEASVPGWGKEATAWHLQVERELVTYPTQLEQFRNATKAPPPANGTHHTDREQRARLEHSITEVEAIVQHLSTPA